MKKRSIEKKRSSDQIKRFVPTTNHDIHNAESEHYIAVVSKDNSILKVKTLFKVSEIAEPTNLTVLQALSSAFALDGHVPSESTDQVNPATQKLNHGLTDNEYQALICIALGLSDFAAGRLLGVTEKAVQARLQLLYSRLGIPSQSDVYNRRCRAIWYASLRGLIDLERLKVSASLIAKKAANLGFDFDG